MTRLAVAPTASALRLLLVLDQRGMKWVASRLDEDPRDEARAVVEGGLGLGNGGNAQDVHVEAIRLHPQTHVDASASGLARKLDHVGTQDAHVAWVRCAPSSRP